MNRERKTDVFESAIQASLSWIHEFGVALGQTYTPSAYRCLRAGLHAIRDRLPISDVVALGSQLPTLIRGAYFEGYAAGARERARAREPIHERVRSELAGIAACPENVLRALFALLGEHVDAGLVSRLRQYLPDDIGEDDLGEIESERPPAAPAEAEERARRGADEERA